MRVEAALVVCVVAIASTGLGLARLWSELDREHDRYRGFDAYEVAHAAALRDQLPLRPLDAFRAAIAPGSRYYLDVREGGESLLSTEGEAMRQFATHWLLPSLPVESPRDADVVLAYGVDVRRLGLRFSQVERPIPGVTVAWVDHPGSSAP
jgi:hypothetical protein